LRSIIYDPSLQSNKTIQKERKLNEAGKLNTPRWVLSIFKREAKRVAKAGMSLVYSGSPRTLYEAFGDEKTEGLVPLIQKMYSPAQTFEAATTGRVQTAEQTAAVRQAVSC